ncbi:hypothetical protein [Anaerococcus obesiensis]|uniref:hypothetical protein n=1 Tax=Anaerococcus obesiensis TaxID=1287640 RepID=UPI001F3583EE|nr:hypothetical protein [Anaerococcus obesiensis]
MVPEKQNVYRLDETSAGDKTAQMESIEKIVDDQTILVPDILENGRLMREYHGKFSS